MKLPQILAISGSTNPHSANNRLLQFLRSRYKHLADLEIYDRIDELPHFNPVADMDNPPDPVHVLRRKIASADALLFCTPEYVFSLPGSLKNAIEWQVSTTLFSGKPTAMIVAAASGKAAFESLLLILSTLECKVPESNRLLIQGIKGKVDDSGLVADAATVNSLESVVCSLVKTI